jgi:large subunit ribosomal protein L29
MKRLETKELEKLSDADLLKRLNDLRSEFSKLKSAAARGTLKKELGEIKTVRRNIARILTVSSMREKGPAKAEEGSSEKTNEKEKKSSEKKLGEKS